MRPLPLRLGCAAAVVRNQGSRITSAGCPVPAYNRPHTSTITALIGQGGIGEVYRDAIHAGGQSGAGVAGYP